MVDDTDPYEPLRVRGEELAGRMLGEEWLARARQADAPFGNDIAALISSLVYGGVWSRTGLSLRDRSLVVIAIHAALARPHEMRIHVPAALRNGVTLAEIEEVLIQVGAYAGFPNAAASNAAIQKLFDDGVIDASAVGETR